MSIRPACRIVLIDDTPIDVYIREGIRLTFLHNDDEVAKDTDNRHCVETQKTTTNEGFLSHAVRSNHFKA